MPAPIAPQMVKNASKILGNRYFVANAIDAMLSGGTLGVSWRMPTERRVQVSLLRLRIAASVSLLRLFSQDVSVTVLFSSSHLSNCAVCSSFGDIWNRETGTLRLDLH
jgi:hypothetical protein